MSKTAIKVSSPAEVATLARMAQALNLPAGYVVQGEATFVAVDFPAGQVAWLVPEPPAGLSPYKGEITPQDDRDSILEAFDPTAERPPKPGMKKLLFLEGLSHTCGRSSPPTLFAPSNRDHRPHAYVTEAFGEHLQKLEPGRYAWAEAV